MIIVLTAIITLSGCYRYDTYSRNGYCYELDTINIHGVDHEFIIKKHSQYFNGFTHSPECPCLKKGE